MKKRNCPICGKEFTKSGKTCGYDCGYAYRASRHLEGSGDASTRLRIELDAHRKRIKEMATERVLNQKYESFVAECASRKFAVPEWVHTPGKLSSKPAIPTLMFSDQHYDEVVDPKQIGGVNEYNRKIASARTEALFRGVVRVGKEHLSGLSYPGIVVAMAGDTFSGNIHEELRETNEGTLVNSLLYWPGMIVAGLRLLADEFGKVYVPAVVGNHSRSTRKPIHKGRVQDNFDYLMAHLVARELAGDKRISFLISESPDVTYRVFGVTYCLTHGDQFRGGSGISGLLSPLMIGDARKRDRAVATGSPYDYLLMGHFHRLSMFHRVIVNGSLKGYDEYAFNSNFGFEPPQQAFWITSQYRQQIWGFTGIHVTERGDPCSGVRDPKTQRAAFAAA